MSMGLFSLSLLVMVAWMLWVVGGVLALHADKMEHKRAPDAGFGIAPIIPLFPLLAILVAFVLDKLFAPWGTRLVGAIHLLLALAFLVGIGRELRRIKSSRNP